ncbi:unnamed protein product [Urochloa decumbens]|uniref:HMA domain-containing protein n=1 Tax=Urochloa decumbens TaxID=240449 RepID=A0ABC9G8Q4_9POAL
MAKGTNLEGGDGAPKASGKGGGTPAAGEEEVVIRVSVHCEDCGRKLRRSLQRIDGVGEVSVDSNTNTVVVRGRKVVENAREAVRIVEKRTGRKAVLLSPAPEKLPPPPAKKTKKDDAGNKGMNELPEIDMKMVVVLRMNLHCDACCEEIKRRILRIKGVEDVVPHLKSSQMMVKGTVEPATLVGFIHKCTGRKSAIFRAEPLDPLPPPAKSPSPAAEAAETKKDNNPTPAENTAEEKNKQDDGKKDEEPQEENKGGGEENKEKPADGDGGAEEKEEAHGGEAGKDAGTGGDDGVVVEEHKKDDHLFAAVPLPAGVVTVPAPETAAVNVARYYYSYPPPPSYYTYAHPSSYYQYQYPQPYYPPYPYACGGHGMYGYPPEAFTEENPNACAIV